ncbi:MAG: propionyl-CoA carboxylase, partial [Nocardioidaceae bacterium]|nr:propionyl-CoA carboxylase [Nocardioidaceae bacterium]
MTQIEVPPAVGSQREVLAQKRRDRMNYKTPTGGREFTARERAEMFVDAGTFVEISPMRTPRANSYGAARADDASGVIVGWGMVEGRPVVVVSHDFSVASGAIGSVFAENVQRAQRMGIDKGYPIVYINDSGGARIHDGIDALHGCGGIFALNVEANYRVPQISLILGPCAGAAAYSPALTDWTIMVKGQGQMFLTGPAIVKAATGEDAHPDDIGGSTLHTKESGVAHLEVASETDAFVAARLLLSFLPSAIGDPQRVVAPIGPNAVAEYSLPTLVPERTSQIFDMKTLLAGVVDDAPGLEMMPTFGTSTLTQFARIDGRPVGIVASQPKSRGGILDSKSSVKVARYVEFCGRFGLPIVTFVDV